MKENLSHHVYKDLRSYVNRMIKLVEKEVTEDTGKALKAALEEFKKSMAF